MRIKNGAEDGIVQAEIKVMQGPLDGTYRRESARARTRTHKMLTVTYNTTGYKD